MAFYQKCWRYLQWFSRENLHHQKLKVIEESLDTRSFMTEDFSLNLEVKYPFIKMLKLYYGSCKKDIDEGFYLEMK